MLCLPLASTLFPTRRSSDLTHAPPSTAALIEMSGVPRCLPTSLATPTWKNGRLKTPEDRKSTRLNSSHITSSYAVFCLKKKKRSRTIDTSMEPQKTELQSGG